MAFLFACAIKEGELGVEQTAGILFYVFKI
jgi:hypothetical protein